MKKASLFTATLIIITLLFVGILSVRTVDADTAIKIEKIKADSQLAYEKEKTKQMEILKSLQNLGK